MRLKIFSVPQQIFRDRYRHQVLGYISEHPGCIAGKSNYWRKLIAEISSVIRSLMENNIKTGKVLTCNATIFGTLTGFLRKRAAIFSANTQPEVLQRMISSGRRFLIVAFNGARTVLRIYCIDTIIAGQSNGMNNMVEEFINL